VESGTPRTLKLVLIEEFRQIVRLVRPHDYPLGRLEFPYLQAMWCIIAHRSGHSEEFPMSTPLECGFIVPSSLVGLTESVGSDVSPRPASHGAEIGGVGHKGLPRRKTNNSPIAKQLF
jgi:hypothetical protein